MGILNGEIEDKIPDNFTSSGEIIQYLENISSKISMIIDRDMNNSTALTGVQWIKEAAEQEQKLLRYLTNLCQILGESGRVREDISNLLNQESHNRLKEDLKYFKKSIENIDRWGLTTVVSQKGRKSGEPHLIELLLNYIKESERSNN